MSVKELARQNRAFLGKELGCSSTVEAVKFVIGGWGVLRSLWVPKDTKSIFKLNGNRITTFLAPLNSPIINQGSEIQHL